MLATNKTVNSDKDNSNEDHSALTENELINLQKNINKRILESANIKESGGGERLEKFLNENTLLLFRDLTAKEKAWLVGCETGKTFLLTFSLWFALNCVYFFNDNAKNFFFPDINFQDMETYGKRILGQAVWAALIQVSVDLVNPFLNSAEAQINKNHTDYIKNPQMLSHMQDRSMVNELIHEIGLLDLGQEDTRSVRKRIGDSSFCFTQNGITEHDGKMGSIRRAFKNLTNNIERSEVANYDAHRKLSLHNASVFAKNNASSLLHFAVGTSSNQMAEDFGAGLFGHLMNALAEKGSFLKAFSVTTNSVIASIPATISSLISAYNKNSLENIVTVGVRAAIDEKNIYMKNNNVGIKSFIDPKYYLEFVTQAAFRAVGRVIFEIPVKKSMATTIDGISKIRNPFKEAIFEGMRNGIGQQGVKFFGRKVFHSLIDFISNSDCCEKKHHSLEELEKGMAFVYNELSADSDAIDEYLSFLTKAETKKDETYDQKILRENWIVNLLGAKIQIENTLKNLKENYEVKKVFLHDRDIMEEYLKSLASEILLKSDLFSRREKREIEEALLNDNFPFFQSKIGKIKTAILQYKFAIPKAKEDLEHFLNCTPTDYGIRNITNTLQYNPRDISEYNLENWGRMALANAILQKNIASNNAKMVAAIVENRYKLTTISETRKNRFFLDSTENTLDEIINLKKPSTDNIQLIRENPNLIKLRSMASNKSKESEVFTVENETKKPDRNKKRIINNKVANAEESVNTRF